MSERVRYGEKLPWSEIPRLLRDEEVDVSIGSTGTRCVVEFTDNLPDRLKEFFSGFEKVATIISGNNPTTTQYYLEDEKEADVRRKFVEFVEKEGLGIEEVKIV